MEKSWWGKKGLKTPFLANQRLQLPRLRQERPQMMVVWGMEISGAQVLFCLRFLYLEAPGWLSQLKTSATSPSATTPACALSDKK